MHSFKMNKSIHFGHLLTTLIVLSARYDVAEATGTVYEYVAPKGFNDTEVEQIRSDILKRANYYRKEHGMNPLNANTNMDNYSQQIANALIERKNVQTNREYGNNTLRCQGNKLLGEDVVDIWYNKMEYANEGSEDDLYYNIKINQLVQLLWSDSRDIGVGVATIEADVYMVEADFYPRGVIKGKYTQNLPAFNDETKQIYQRLKKSQSTPSIKIYVPPPIKIVPPQDPSTLANQNIIPNSEPNSLKPSPTTPDSETRSRVTLSTKTPDSETRSRVTLSTTTPDSETRSRVTLSTTTPDSETKSFLTSSPITPLKVVTPSQGN